MATTCPPSPSSALPLSSTAPPTAASPALPHPSSVAAATAAAAKASPHPFAYRRKRTTTADGAGSEQIDKAGTDSAADMSWFGRHHPRRAELQGAWEEELIAQRQKIAEEDNNGDEDSRRAKKKASGAAEEALNEQRGDRSPAPTADSSSSVITSLASTTVVAPASYASPSTSSAAQDLSSAPTTPLSAADASLSSVLHLLAADKQPTLPERCCNLLTTAIAFHATLMQHFTSHVLQSPQSDSSAATTQAVASASPAADTPSLAQQGADKLLAAKQEDTTSTLPLFAAKYSTELTSSLDALKEADALLAEWKKDTSLSASDLAACDSLHTHVLSPLMATFTSLLSPNPSLAAVASPSSLVASFLLAKRGRGRLHKCDKHRRWKKKCPADCPDKPVGRWEDSAAMDEDDEDEEDEDEGEDDKAKKGEQPRSTDQSPGAALADKRRKLDAAEEQSAARAQPSAKRAQEVVKAVHAFQPIATATAINPVPATAAPSTAASVSSPHASPPSLLSGPTKEDIVRARETALAASVIPSAVSLASAASPMPHTAQMLAHPVARPASLQSAQQTATLYAAQPLVLQSSLPSRSTMQPATLYTFNPASQLAPSISSASFAQSAPHPTHTHTHAHAHATHALVTLEQLNAIQQQGGSFRIVQPNQTAPHPHSHTHTTAYAQPYNAAQISMMYANAAGGGGVVGGGPGAPQSFTFNSLPGGGYSLQQ